MVVFPCEAIPAAVEQLVSQTQSGLILVSAYFDPWLRLESTLRALSKARRVRVDLLIRGGDTLAKHQERTQQLRADGVHVHYLDRLHAKIYLNEQAALITSMNLVQASASGSWESGILLTLKDDRAAYQAILHQAQQLIERAHQETRMGAPISAPAPASKAKLTPTPRQPSPRKAPTPGVCIRCSAKVKLNPGKPLCGDCWASWAQFENEDYEENYCHLCGRAARSSMRKPLCSQCFKLAS